MDVRELIASWYLRLNGYFVMPNFIAHAHDGARTDVDVLAVRFPHSTEYPDDSHLAFTSSAIDILFVEVKSGQCSLNGPWKGKSEKQPLEYVLKRVGVFDDSARVDVVASQIYACRRFPSPQDAQHWPFVIRIVCFGESEDKQLQGVIQILWPQVMAFMKTRFMTYAGEKADHNHWDSFGKFLCEQLSGDQQINLDQLSSKWRATCPCYP